MSEISFKNVGEKRTARKFQAIQDAKPVGIQTPLQLDATTTSLFVMHTDVGDQVADNLRNLIMTNHGERLGLFDFGANLRELTTELTSRDDFESEAMLRIRDAAKKYMPFVELDSFEAAYENFSKPSSFAKVTIRVAFNVPRLGISKRKIEAILYTIG